MSSAKSDGRSKRRAIGRKKLQHEKVVPVSMPTASVFEDASSKRAKEEDWGGGYPHDLSVRIDVLLYEVVDNFVTSANTGGDYSYTSAADFIRAAIREHAGGKKLQAKAEGKKKKRMTLRVDDEVKTHYEGLPRGKRTEILERAIRTKLLA